MGYAFFYILFPRWRGLVRACMHGGVGMIRAAELGGIICYIESPSDFGKLLLLLLLLLL